MAHLFQVHWRLFYLFAFGVVISGLKSVNILLFLTACLVPCVLISQIFYGRSLKALGRLWLKFNIFTLLIWLTLSWRLDTFSVQWNPHGIELASLISLRMNLILCATWLLLLNVNEVMLVQAISRLPLSPKLIHLFVLSIRYISVLNDVNRKMDIAMRARGYQPKCNWLTLKITSQRVALLLIHAMVRAERTEMALKARGFKFGAK
ncbi:energy-coupling factor transporter transmembrane protein EcfT [Actinobacillus equuli subsp. haemolyticus]|uniref:energy-coupling factor transporter transmembrane component T family protein n=1 Tax=Actinobacillus equuli TaxID=718 RepID=UPI00244123F1|nr:energy-coupling factor transporter transmembrane component T [Actinobacillus equuli]WGE81104.1 energy-coupling factor transporter transmembrane protein EcfT [Actinobacillus equuli subsp. haemolyticus]